MTEERTTSMMEKGRREMAQLNSSTYKGLRARTVGDSQVVVV